MMDRLRARHAGGDRGMTLVELLVGSTLLMIVMGMVGSTLVTTAESSRRIRTDHDLNEEARNALNRVARELRQATQLAHASNPSGSGYSPGAVTALSLEADFNGDGCSGNSCSGTDVTNNPESLTYCFDPTAPGIAKTYLWLIPEAVTTAPSSCQVLGALPILAGDVTGFRVEYRSDEYRHDLNPTDGITTWEEVDAAPPPVGDAGGPDGDINTSALTRISSLVIHLTMGADGRTQDYTTQVDLRNRS